MGHPIVENETRTAFELVPTYDEEGLPVVATIIKATCRIVDGKRAELVPDQRPVLLAGELQGDVECPSYKYEPEGIFTKPSTDVVLIGHAHAPKPGAQTLDVGLKVGPVQKIVRVFGDRYWVKTGGTIIATRPKPFERVPLLYERAFGGWDRSHKDRSHWRCDLRNPVGRGFGDPLRYVEEGKVPLPNIEDPKHLIKRYGDTPPPAGFGFLSEHWKHRAQYSGTYDDVWDKERKPLLPKDFDRRFFNAASPGLIVPGYLRGDEEVVIVNASPTPQLRFRLPGLPAPMCRLELRNRKITVLNTQLDTVIVNADEMLVFLLWRAYTPISSGAHDVATVEVTMTHAAQQAALA